ncbi:hypothetical protein SARC_11806 [Sphaeroforma arctica JP610]|uniref:Uncharacterized protein n=1 Tax=Sphaeroforma arctica JP610 TaxID=667725 RepID=A0A0L0FFX8_9EUKA|nr:hypothetical protein SARC_11806 [Sphaeroforma arctica JP610]KNC75674.1 hypothetical protein SARC_11806 [Sphaeroforma arctica JP610]|eukprot:XP_014149576.1 hypothetical protein SARC_11806 [Sphaeroforma arctica JP610]
MEDHNRNTQRYQAILLLEYSDVWRGLLWDCARLVRVRKDGTPYCCTQHDQTPHSSVIPTVGGTSNSSEGASTETGRIAPGDEQGEDEVVSGLENVQRVMRRLWEAARRVSAPQND